MKTTKFYDALDMFFFQILSELWKLLRDKTKVDETITKIMYILLLYFILCLKYLK